MSSSVEAHNQSNEDNEVEENKGWSSQRIIDKLTRMCQTAECFIICVVICSLTPVVFVLGLVVPKTMADDGVTTMQEMMKVLMEAMNNCQRSLEGDLAPKDPQGDYYDVYCKGEWDMITCWPNSAPGTTVDIGCPEYIPDFDHAGKAQRFCNDQGYWVTVQNSSKVWTDYSNCRYPRIEEVKEAIKNDGDPKLKSLIMLYTVGYSCSLIALTFAMIILAYFKRLHCTRNYIHMHLFASFIMRAIVIFVKDGVLYRGSGIMDAITQNGDAASAMNYTNGQENFLYQIRCKIVMTFFHYFVSTNYYWILVEALYLHSLIFVPFFSEKKYLWRFTITGWGVPVLFVLPWAIVRATLGEVNSCWDIAVSEYKWIYNGPIVVANVINFLLFLNIIRVLWYKMRERGTIGRRDNKRQYKKLAKSTLVLIPMFGVHAIVFIGMPDNITSGVWWDIWMYFDLFFNSFQGFFVAIIYCFCNGEVQAEFKKTWNRFNISVEIQKGRRERSRSSVTMLASFNSSASHQARLSIGGQSANRNAFNRSNATSLLGGASVQTSEEKPGITHQKRDNSRNKTTTETSFITERNLNENNNDVEGHSSIHRHPFIRMQSCTIPKGSDVILPIAEEHGLEEAFEEAVEEDEIQEEMGGSTRSFALAEDSVDAEEKADIFDDVISRDETTALRQKRMQRAKRAESEDSGISSLYLTAARSWRGEGYLSASDYCVDNAGAHHDYPSHSGNDESVFLKTAQTNDVSVTCEKSEINLPESKKFLNNSVENEL